MRRAKIARMFLLLIIAVATLTALLPWIVPKVGARYRLSLKNAPIWLPLLAAMVYIASLYLPDVRISHETDTFQQHFFGGGVYTTLLFIYFTKLAGWRPWWPLALTALFAWTSALGTLNELAEFTLTKLNITQINLQDMGWDLFANTSGALTAFIVWQLIERSTRRKS